MTTPTLAQNSFKTEQLKFERVRNAYAEKWSSLQKNLQSSGFNGPFEMYIAAYKTEGKVEIWLKTTH